MLAPEERQQQMADSATLSTQQLYKAWRAGDATAGQAMAQRFSDWYYAVTTCRLGDAHGRSPLQRACVRFQQGIVSVAGQNELVDWAHSILAEEIRMAGGRIAGGDFPNQVTGGRSPTDLLQKAARAMPAEQVALLSAAYDSTIPLERVQADAERMGGYPLAVLQARYALKTWLRDNAGVAFTVIPAEPNLDAAPLPLYEAGRMANAAEETGFEKWMLSNMPLCKDIAEFGVMAQALRAGGLRPNAPSEVTTLPPQKSEVGTGRRQAPESSPPLDDEPPPKQNMIPMAVGGLLVAGFLFVVLAGIVFFVLNR